MARKVRKGGQFWLKPSVIKKNEGWRVRMWNGMGGICVDVAFGWSLVKKGRKRLKKFLTAGHSCEIGLYDVEI